MLRKTWIRIILLAAPAIFVLCCILFRSTAYYIAENILPECESYSHFGIYCPGCGLTRCILAIMSGNLWLAFRNNAVIFCLFTFLVLLYAEAVFLSYGKDVHLLPRKAWFYAAFGVCAALYLILRNFIPILEPIPIIY